MPTEAARRGQAATISRVKLAAGTPLQYRAAGFALVSAAWVGFLHGHAIQNTFVYDDVAQVVENIEIRSITGAAGYFLRTVPFSSEYLANAGAFYRPLFWMSLSLDYHVWELSARGFRLTNLVLHWICGLLLFLLLSRLGLPRSLVFGVPLAWIALPVNTEVAAWISARPFSLATTFILAGMLLLDRFLASGRALNLVGLTVACLGVLLSHESGIILPIVSLLLIARRNRLQARVLLCAGGAFVAAFSAYALLRVAAGSGDLASPALTDVAAALQRVPLLVTKYLAWILFPIRLSVERSSDWAHLTPSTAGVVCGWLMIAAASTATLLIRRRLPVVVLGLTWFAVTLLPFLNLVPLSQGMAERYVYLASMGIVLALGGGLVVLLEQKFSLKAATAAALVLLVSLYAMRASSRVEEWRDEWTLYASSLEASPNSHVLRYNLAVKYAESGDADKAESLYRAAIALRPGYHAAKVNLANLLQRQGNFEGARRMYEEVLEAQPDRKEALLNLGNLLQRTGRVEAAENAYQAALAIDPRYVEAELNLGALYQSTGRAEKARAAYERVLSLAPGQAQAHMNLGVLSFHQNEVDPAIAHLSRAIALDPTSAESHFNLGVIYDAAGDVERARREYERALALRPHYDKARAYLQRLAR